MAQPLDANLVVANSKTVNALTDRARSCGAARRDERLEVVVLVEPALIAEREDSLFGLKIIQLEFPDLHVDPAAVEQVIEARPHGFEMERAGAVRRGQH